MVSSDDKWLGLLFTETAPHAVVQVSDQKAVHRQARECHQLHRQHVDGHQDDDPHEYHIEAPAEPRKYGFRGEVEGSCSDERRCHHDQHPGHEHAGNAPPPATHEPAAGAQGAQRTRALEQQNRHGEDPAEVQHQEHDRGASEQHCDDAHTDPEDGRSRRQVVVDVVA